MIVGIGDVAVTYSPCSSKYADKKLLPYEVMQFPEFWEEVKEKEWEIIDESQWIKGNLYFNGGITSSFKTIKSVKRLSDNTIFSIGDKIKCINSRVNKPEAIIKIELNKEGTPCLFTNTFCNNGVNIFKAIKCEKILTTEDGVEIFENDAVFCVDNAFSDPFKSNGLAIRNSPNSRNNYKYFSTKNAAEEYVKSNKGPLFVTEDGVEIFKGDNYWFVVKSDLEILKAWTPRLHICDWDYSDGYKKPPLGHVQFSTEKAAKNWIKLNKPQYSLQDIFNAKSEGSKFPTHFAIDFDKLKK